MAGLGRCGEAGYPAGGCTGGSPAPRAPRHHPRSRHTGRSGMRIGQIAIDVAPLREGRDFRLLFTGRFVSMAGNAVAMTAADWQVYGLTRSSLAVGMLTLADSAGMFAVLLAGALSGLGSPASTAAVPGLVGPDRLAAAAALNAMGNQLGNLGGPALAGALIAGPGLASCYAIDAACFAVFGLTVWFIRPLPPTVRAGRPGLRSMAEGLRHVRHNAVVGGMLAVDTSAMIFGMPSALFPALAREHFHGGAATFGLLAAAPGLGAMLGAATSGWTGRLRRPGVVVIWAGLAWGGAIIGFGFSGSLAIALAFLAVAGMADLISEVLRNALLQHYTPDELRGRVSSLYLAQVTTAPSLGNVEAGLVAQLFTVGISVVSGGLACVAGALVLGAVNPALRRATLARPRDGDGDVGGGGELGDGLAAEAQARPDLLARAGALVGVRQARRRQRAARRSASTWRTTLRPGIPVTPPPPCVDEPAWYRPRSGVRRSAYPAAGLAWNICPMVSSPWKMLPPTRPYSSCIWCGPITWRCRTDSANPGATSSILVITRSAYCSISPSSGWSAKLCGTHWVNMDMTCWPAGASESSNTLGMQMSANGTEDGLPATASWKDVSISSRLSASTMVPPCTCRSSARLILTVPLLLCQPRMSATKPAGRTAGSTKRRNEIVGCIVVTTVPAGTCSPVARSTPVARPARVVMAATSVPVLISAPKPRAAAASAAVTAPMPPRGKPQAPAWPPVSPM